MDPDKKARFGKALEETRKRQQEAARDREDKLSRTATPKRAKRRRSGPATEQP